MPALTFFAKPIRTNEERGMSLAINSSKKLCFDRNQSRACLHVEDLVDGKLLLRPTSERGVSPPVATGARAQTAQTSAVAGFLGQSRS